MGRVGHEMEQALKILEYVMNWSRSSNMGKVGHGQEQMVKHGKVFHRQEQMLKHGEIRSWTGAGAQTWEK